MSTSRRKPYATEEPVTADELLESSPFGGDLDAELAARPEGRRMSGLTMALGAGVLLVAGMLAGIQLQKAWGASSPSGGRQALAGQVLGGGYGGQRAGGARGGYPGAGGLAQGQAPGNGSGQAGGNGGFGGLGDVTFGTIKLVDGGKIYVQTMDGGVVTVTTSSDTKVQVTKDGKVKDLKPGTTVTVRGQRAGDGSVKAGSVNQGGAVGAFGNRGGGG
ncbi:hypothetical protein [Sphaerisporangium fuscum]|uniref:hypothetical protein n=1 Tax=Sphaerisporangium fuscum TaxID=2835868 RepID=UPI001BDD7721|nr:hypothetical protein [Sphaerisporangium fuscum]